MRLAGPARPNHPDSVGNRTHFLGIAAPAMRMVLVDHARKRRAVKRGGGLEALTLEGTEVLCLDRTPDILEVDEALHQLEKVDGRKAKVIEKRFFGGMTREEIATDLDLTLETVERDLRSGLAWLRRFLAGEISHE
jgi:RNA polymerase sigma-70 factor, ECF subfamily